MLYRIAKIVCRYCIQIYYGKIEINGLEHLPTQTPMLLACNHPTGFLEPVIIACVLDRPLHFITRGDLFANKLLGPLLRWTNQIPIYRFKDGYTDLKKNSESIKAAESALQNGGALLMFVEGKTEDIKMLKPLQKGMARISASLHQQGLQHCIVPVGINFVDTVTFRSKIMLNFGEAIDPHPIIEQQESQRHYFKQINEIIFEKVKKVMLHVSRRDRYPLHDRLIDLYQATLRHSFLPVLDDELQSFSGYKKISDFVDQASDEELSNIDSKLPSLEGKSRHLLRKQTSPLSYYLWLLVLSPFAFIGCLFHVVPIGLGYLTERLLVESREFVAPIRFSASMGIGLIWYFTLGIFGVTQYGLWGLLILLMLLCGKAALYWWYLYMSVSKKYTLEDKSIDGLVTIFTSIKG